MGRTTAQEDMLRFTSVNVAAGECGCVAPAVAGGAIRSAMANQRTAVSLGSEALKRSIAKSMKARIFSGRYLRLT